jgi:tRNA U54 and U55 pseudouridine synthase Pus10
MVDVTVRGSGEGRPVVLENHDIRRLAGLVPSQL